MYHSEDLTARAVFCPQRPDICSQREIFIHNGPISAESGSGYGRYPENTDRITEQEAKDKCLRDKYTVGKKIEKGRLSRDRLEDGPCKGGCKVFIFFA